MRTRRIVAIGVIASSASLGGCISTDEVTSPPGIDGSFALDAGEGFDGGMHDATSPVDATTGDATLPDATLPDATLPDAALPDAAPSDATVPDSAPADASDAAADAPSAPDAPVDTGAADVAPDAPVDAAPDASPVEAGADACVPRTCADAGANCGVIGDGCGGTLFCGNCAGNATCGGSGAPNVCGLPSTCTGLCAAQTVCPGSGTTSVSGTVFAPNGVDPLPNVFVYVPNAPVQPLTPGVQCGVCGTSSGSPLVWGVTDASGHFTIANMPVGTNVPLVLQSGRWRRQMVIPNVAACTNTALPASGTSQARLPRTSAEGDIPLMALVTGNSDALECALRKVGVSDAEFTDPSGTGRVRFYLGDGAAGAKLSASTPAEAQLWGTQAALDQYDMVYFACQGSAFARTSAAQQALINFTNAGGRVLADHDEYVWLYDVPPFSGTAAWNVGQTAPFASDPQTAYIDTSFPRAATLAQWLLAVGASTTLGQVTIGSLKHDFDGVVAPSRLWLSVKDASLGTVPMHYTFDTPTNAPAGSACGRVLFDDFHVEAATGTGGQTFPAECASGSETPEEKLLEYAIFDLGACLTPASCKPATCTGLCGSIPDGCGNVLPCGGCSGAGEQCIGGRCVTGGACNPLTCAQQGFDCGSATDGCGNTIQCGTCVGAQVCGGSGRPNVCGGGY